jgi:hypothetical protein
MVWRMTKYRHFTMLPQPDPEFTQLGFYLQLNTKTVNIFKKKIIQKKANQHDGDLNHIINPINMMVTLAT